MIERTIHPHPRTGKVRIKTISTEGYKIIRDDGKIYDTAIDPYDTLRTYEETSISIDEI